MSDPEESFIQNINENLFLKSQYKFNSGGDPKAITDLEFDDLVAFHKKYYHPSNCTFLTYGDLDFADHLKFIDQEVIGNSKFENQDASSSELLLESTPKEMIRAEVKFMPDLMSDPGSQTIFGLSYLCNQMSEDSFETFKL